MIIIKPDATTQLVSDTVRLTVDGHVRQLVWGEHCHHHHYVGDDTDDGDDAADDDDVMVVEEFVEHLLFLFICRETIQIYSWQ